MTQQTIWNGDGKIVVDTRRAAAAAIAPHLGELQSRVYEFIKSRGAFGATDREGQEALNMDGSTYRPRRDELVDAGLVELAGTTRPSPSKRPCKVWISAQQTNQREQ
jgi:hypothetical protein